MGFSQITLIGHLGRDPEMNYTPTGKAVTKFSLAVTTKQSGNDKTTWYNVVAWEKTAETLNQYLHKGDQFFVQGSLDARQYEAKDGKHGLSLDVTVERFSFLSSSKQHTAQPEHEDKEPDFNQPF